MHCEYFEEYLFTGLRLSGAGLGLWQTALKANFNYIVDDLVSNWYSMILLAATWHVVVGQLELRHLLLTVLLSGLLGEQRGEWSAGRFVMVVI